jgi:hypothetical protein
LAGSFQEFFFLVQLQCASHHTCEHGNFPPLGVTVTAAAPIGEHGGTGVPLNQQVT